MDPQTCNETPETDHGLPPPIPAIWKPLDDGSSPKATDQYLHPWYGNGSRTGAAETGAEADREFLTLALPTPDTLPTFTARDWTGESTPRPRTFSLRSTISHTSWKSWNNDRRVDSAHQGPNSERRTFSMRSLSRRLSVVETPPPKDPPEKAAPREDADFLSLLKESRLTPDAAAGTARRRRPKSIAVHEAAGTSNVSLALYQPHEDDWKRQTEPTDGTGLDEKCLASELNDDKIPMIPEEQPIGSTPPPLTTSNLHTLGTITADSLHLAKDKDLPDLPLPAYPPTSDTGSSTFSATRTRRHASNTRTPHRGSTAGAAHHHRRSRSSTTHFFGLVPRRRTTVTGANPNAAATATTSTRNNNNNNNNNEGRPPAPSTTPRRAPTILSRVPTLLLSRTSTLRTRRSSTFPLNRHASTKTRPVKPVPLATITRHCGASAASDQNDNGNPIRAQAERVGAWVSTQQERGLVAQFREQGRRDEYARARAEERERRRMREMEEERERAGCARWRIRRWLVMGEEGGGEGELGEMGEMGEMGGGGGGAGAGGDGGMAVVDGMVEWPEEGIWDGFVDGGEVGSVGEEDEEEW
ncbi:uncharacterized protein BKCO1_3800025 [Diplodia corticola]|uniref:Uncharacterized protein n=1 Tax=Diplodia corticola TaxID=236234 RepID=A0A1J9QVP0_9PEZI|nr:uncharacterized protein BKCO1_3800025 [Diplodia corticola]OJD32449.1 hypothetical protein BKCO1_3800025 [Diplodia corticola]